MSRNWNIAEHLGETLVELPDGPPNQPSSVLMANPPRNPGDRIETQWTPMLAGAGGGGVGIPMATKANQIITSGSSAGFPWEAHDFIDGGRY